MKKFSIIMLVLVMAVSAIIGVTYSVKHEENRKDEDLIVRASYEQLISDLENDIASSMQNVAELQAEIELNGLTISNLTTSVVTYKNQVTKLENSVEKYEEDLVVKTSELEAKTGEIAELTAQLENSEEENTELLAQIEILTEEKISLETEIAELSSEKENLETLISEKEAEITELSNSISAKNAELETLANQVAEKQTTIDGLNTQVANLLAEIENLEKNVLDKDETIENLNNQVLDLQGQVSELNTQIDELNATIFDLNTRIDILEEQLANSGTNEKDPNKTYIDDFNVEYLAFVPVNDEKCLFYGTNGFNYGLYELYFSDYSVKTIDEDGFAYSCTYVLNDGNYIYSSSYTAFLGLKHYNSKTETITYLYEDGDAYGLYYNAKFSDNKMILSDVHNSKKFYVIDGDTLEVEEIDTSLYDYGYINSVYGLNADACIFSIEGNLYLFDNIDNAFVNLNEFGELTPLGIEYAKNKYLIYCGSEAIIYNHTSEKIISRSEPFDMGFDTIELDEANNVVKLLCKSELISEYYIFDIATETFSKVTA